MSKTSNKDANGTKKELDKSLMNDLIAEDAEPANFDLKDVTIGDKPKLNDETLIKVKSNRMGTLFYKDRSGLKTVWKKCGDMQELPLKELRDIKVTSPRFFTDQWLIILGISNTDECTAKPADIYRALNITKYYENMIDPSNFSDICFYSANQIKARVPLLTKGAKENLIVAIKGYISKGLIDSRKTIVDWEDALGCKLSEK